MTKLYCIIARAAETGVIFRRGPGKQIRLIKWNLKKHTFELGQWFKGQIYVRKSDLSPDGTKLVYFAAKFRGELPTWIAVSTPPYLTAHVLWPTIGTWNDLSLFETNNDLALATYRSDSSLEPFAGTRIPRQLTVKNKPWPGYFHKLADHDRLIRDGWLVQSGDPLYRGKSSATPLIYRKLVRAMTRPACLELSVTADIKLTYLLRDDTDILTHLNAEWADVHGEEVLYSIGGKLLCSRIKTSGKRIVYEPPVELGDFSDMTFEPIKAPAAALVW